MLSDLSMSLSLSLSVFLYRSSITKLLCFRWDSVCLELCSTTLCSSPSRNQPNVISKLYCFDLANACDMTLQKCDFKGLRIQIRTYRNKIKTALLFLIFISYDQHCRKISDIFGKPQKRSSTNGQAIKRGRELSP